MAVFEIPLSPQPQRFKIQLGSVFYQMTVRWNDATEGGWTADLADTDGNPILLTIPFITGADLLAQFSYLGTPGELLVQTQQETDAVPTYVNLGDASRVYFRPAE